MSCLDTVAVSKSLVDLAREVAREQGQPAGKEEDSETSDENGPLPVPKSARVVSGRRHHRLRMLVDLLVYRDRIEIVAPGAKSCGDTRSATGSSNRSRNVPQICKGARVPFLRRCRSRRCPGGVFERLLCPGITASPLFTASCSRDGSLAVIQPLWAQQTVEVPSFFEGVATAQTCAHPMSSAHARMGRHCNITHPSQPSSHDCVHPHFAGNADASVRASGIEKEGFCPTACATSPMLVGRNRSLRNWSVHQDRGRDSFVLMDQRWLQWINKLLPRLKCGNLEKRIWYFDHLAAANRFKTAPTL